MQPGNASIEQPQQATPTANHSEERVAPMYKQTSPTSRPLSYRAILELEKLRDGIITLASIILSDSKRQQPMAGGITRLGKFEPIMVETRFIKSQIDDRIAWLNQSVNFRMRQGQYTSGVLLLPDAVSTNRDFKAQIMTSHQRNGVIHHFGMQLKSKRPGQLTFSSPVAL